MTTDDHASSGKSIFLLASLVGTGPREDFICRLSSFTLPPKRRNALTVRNLLRNIMTCLSFPSMTK